MSARLPSRLFFLFLLYLALTAPESRANSDDQYWDHWFGPGVDGTVRALVVDSGDLYVGGSFLRAGEISSPGIVRWDGDAWHSLGTGIQGEVRAIVLHEASVYAAGAIGSAGGIPTSNIARWDGSSWHACGDGIDGTVNALLSFGGYVYAAGNFTMAGNIVTNNIARWDGSAWSSVGLGTNGVIVAMVVHGGGIHIGGDFSSAGGITANKLARWDGSTWSAPGDGGEWIAGSADIASMMSDGDRIIIGGHFVEVIPPTAAQGYIASWSNGWYYDWLYEDFSVGPQGPVHAIADGFVGGRFRTVRRHAYQDIEARGVAAGTTGGWSGVDRGVLGDVYALAVSGDDLYVGGSFRSVAGGISVENIARFDGEQWRALGAGGPSSVSNSILAIAGDEVNGVYVGGEFVWAGGTSALSVAQWHDEQWKPLGPGLKRSPLGTMGPAEVHSMFLDGSDLYVGGFFRLASDLELRSLAMWNGTEWSDVGGGVSVPTDVGIVDEIVVRDENVFVGGAFTTAGLQQNASNIAVWNGDTWSAFGDGLNGPVRAICVVDGQLYAGGDFDHSGVTIASNIAAWNGTTWVSMGDGLNGPVRSIVPFGNQILAVGNFSASGPTPIDRIAVWDGVTWSPFASELGFDNVVRRVVVAPGGSVFVAGAFSTVAGIDAPGVAWWDGAAWNPLGSGSGQVRDMILIDSKIYIGGPFGEAGGAPSPYFARWNHPTALPVAITSFDARPFESSVELNWTVRDDGDLSGFRVTRREGGEAPKQLVGGVLDASARNYVDAAVLPGHEYYYTLYAEENDGSVIASPEVMVRTRQFQNLLMQNIPNPFNPTTRIVYELESDGLVNVSIYDASGALVTVLENRERRAGRYETVWTGTNTNGEAVSSGVYFYRLRTPKVMMSRKMVLLK